MLKFFFSILIYFTSISYAYAYIGPGLGVGAVLTALGFIVLIVFFVQDSKPDNKYGANPKAA